jgi:pimeloyl-ACP methyl ester carboxylesterase
MGSNKKDKTPPLLRFIQWGFPKLERIAPFLAYRYFIKIFFTPLKYSIPAKEKEIASRAELFSFDIKGKKIQAYKWGQGPIVLFVHGWAGRATQFRKFIEAFTEKGFQAVAFDGPAHGRSEGKETNQVEFNQVLQHLYQILPEPPTAVITHSFGGVATLFSMMNGVPITRLINISSPTIGDEIINTYLRTIHGTRKTGDYFKKYVLKTTGKPFDEFTSLYFIKHLLRPVRLLLIHDEEDKEAIIRHAEELVKLYPSAELIRTKGLGHTRILKDDQVIQTCLKFVAS